MKYGALGDVLNAGSRLEGLNKVIGTSICVSGEVVEKSARHAFRPIATFLVKGKQTPLDVYEPLAAGGRDDEHLCRYLRAYEALRSGAPAAAELIAALHDATPSDPVIAFHHQRLAQGGSGVRIEMAEK